jgi:hypothetical protein
MARPGHLDHAGVGYLLLEVAPETGDHCSDGTEPVPNLLNGLWGSDQVSLVAISSGAEVQFQCALIAIEDGIELDANHRFSVRGQPRTYFPGGKPPEVRITGEALPTGDVSLTVPDPFTGETATHELQPDVEPVRVPNCPQPAGSSQP